MYERINWENKPSAATPINAENLNKMDKGIKDIDEGKIAKADLVQTDQVNNPEKVPSSAVTFALGQEIDTLNNNLAQLNINSVGQLNQMTGATLTSESSVLDIFNAMPNGCSLNNLYTFGDNYPYSFNKLFSVQKTSANGGMIVWCYGYAMASPKLSYCIINNAGIATEWIPMPDLSV